MNMIKTRADEGKTIEICRDQIFSGEASKSWQKPGPKVSIYSFGVDHDYLNKDSSLIPDRFRNTNREALLAVWRQSQNDVEHEQDGIYFKTRMGLLSKI
jgi:hypothetical protein